MKIALITQITPAAENIRGTSALPYHLMIHKPKEVDILIYSFNGNKLSTEKIKEIEEELNVKIVLLSQPLWLTWVLRFHLLAVRVFLKYPIFNYIKLPTRIVTEIKNQKPDGIWIYGQEISRITKQFHGFKRVHILPDCESLYYYRMLAQRCVFKKRLSFLRNMIMYSKYLRMEGNYENDKTVKYYLVGDADTESLKNINTGIQAYFIRHPHYHVTAQKKDISFSVSKIKLLIAGQNNHYMQQCAGELVSALYRERHNLCGYYKITFLGRGWEQRVSELQTAGYEVKHITFAPDYIEEISKHDIQLTPISIGTGTKGKVLDAIANGLLVIGTPYALENIAVKSGESCIEYRSAAEVMDILRNIPMERKKYEEMAKRGREAVCRYHSRRAISEQLFNLFK
ncbi:glycosyltransferase [Hoylesella oralis]|uniref:glycosyltransferase n=1 Tax=Hoylesella oralis TaxID=28134 RepID=UPI0028E53510|nr:glycosyltransferase [Hoylesella oralis]